MSQGAISTVSTPINIICEKCRYQGSSMVLWGGREYTDGHISSFAKSILGWCSSCTKLVPIEDFSDEQQVIQKLGYLRKWIERWPGQRIALLMAARKRARRRETLQELEAYVTRLALIRARRGTEKCLVCGSPEIFSLEGQWELEYHISGTYIGKRRTGFIHPNCGGEFIATPCEWNFHVKHPVRYYNLQGKPIGQCWEEDQR